MVEVKLESREVTSLKWPVRNLTDGLSLLIDRFFVKQTINYQINFKTIAVGAAWVRTLCLERLEGFKSKHTS